MKVETRNQETIETFHKMKHFTHDKGNILEKILDFFCRTRNSTWVGRTIDS